MLCMKVKIYIRNFENIYVLHNQIFPNCGRADLSDNMKGFCTNSNVPESVLKVKSVMSFLCTNIFIATAICEGSDPSLLQSCLVILSPKRKSVFTRKYDKSLSQNSRVTYLLEKKCGTYGFQAF